jgi:hypothetical protein
MSYNLLTENLTTASNLTLGSIVAGGVRTTSTSTAPAIKTVGDIWYNNSTDALYRYTSDGVNSYWLDITGPTITSNTTTFFGGTTVFPITVNNLAASVSTTTGALVVTGGVGIGGNLYVNGMITANTLTIAYTTITNLQILSTDTVIISNSAITNSTTTGALQVQGGAGIGGSVYVAGVVTATTFIGNATTASYATTATTSTNAATAYSTVNVHTAGTGLSGSTFNGSTAVTWTLNTSTLMNTSTWATTATFATTATNAFQATQSTTATNAFQATQSTTATNAFQATQSTTATWAVTATFATTATSAANAYAVVGGYVSSITAGTDTVITPTTGAVTIWDSSTLQTVTARGASTTNAVTVNNSTNATSTNSGALQIVNGGLGVGGNIWLGGILSFKPSAGVNGISFNNNTAGTGTEALLADYEVGTFVPTLAPGSGSPTITYGATVNATSEYFGRYTKIGNMVYCQIALFITAIGNGGSGNVNIASLPFTTVSPGYDAGAIGTINNISHSSSRTQFGLRTNPGTTNATLWEFGLATGAIGDSAVQWSVLSTTTQINLTLSLAYRATF